MAVVAGRMVGIRCAVETGLVAGIAVLVCPGKFAVDMALRTLNSGMRAGQAESRQIMVKVGCPPVFLRMAIRAGSAVIACRMIRIGRGVVTRLMAAVTENRQIHIPSVTMARLTIQRCVYIQQRKSGQMMAFEHLGLIVPALRRMAGSAIRGKLPAMNVHVALPALLRGLGEDQ